MFIFSVSHQNTSCSCWSSKCVEYIPLLLKHLQSLCFKLQPCLLACVLLPVSAGALLCFLWCSCLLSITEMMRNQQQDCVHALYKHLLFSTTNGERTLLGTFIIDICNFLAWTGHKFQVIQCLSYFLYIWAAPMQMKKITWQNKVLNAFFFSTPHATAVAISVIATPELSPRGMREGSWTCSYF